MADGIIAEGAVLEVLTSGTPTVSPVWTPIVERAQVNDAKTGESIDMSNFDDAGFRGRRAGLRSMNISANGNYVPSDAGYAKLSQSWLDGENVWIRHTWLTNDGLNRIGWYVNSVVNNLSENGSVGGKVELPLAFESNGAPTEVSFAI